MASRIRLWPSTTMPPLWVQLVQNFDSSNIPWILIHFPVLWLCGGVMGDLHHMGNVDSCHLSSAVNWQRSIRVKEEMELMGRLKVWTWRTTGKSELPRFGLEQALQLTAAHNDKEQMGSVDRPSMAVDWLNWDDCWHGNSYLCNVFQMEESDGQSS